LPIFKTGDNPNVYALCDAHFDPDKIDILCDPSRGVPSAVPSILSSPTLSSSISSLVPSTTPSTPPSLVPSSSSAPTSAPDCSCGVGEFKFELELKTDWFPNETSWQIEDGNGDILVSESGYDYHGEQLTTFNYEYCLPVGCYDFVIEDSFGDGLCCLSDYYDDGYFYDDYFGVEEIDDFDGYYEGSVYGWKEVFHGGNFQFNATEHFCGEDVCPFATHYPSTSPSTSSRPSILSLPTMINDDYYYYDDYDDYYYYDDYDDSIADDDYY